MNPMPDQFLAGIAARRERAAKVRTSAPRCTNRRMHRGVERRCNTVTIQNEVERSRHVHWCPRCGLYPWGVGIRPDDVPDEAWPASP